MVVGIIDIGTNSVLLLIAKINPNQSVTVLHDECVITRLGEKISPLLLRGGWGSFKIAAMDRTLTALRNFQTTCKKHNCVAIKAYGTAGFRMARNASTFIKRVKNETGINITVIDGNEEARLIYESCRNDFGHLGNIAVLDIGGGSTEIVTAEEMTSFPFGVVTLTDKFLRSDPPKKEEIEQLRQFVSTFISSSAFRRPYSGVGRRATNDGRLIATAGTPTTLMAIHLGLKKYDSTKVHGQRLTVNNIHHLKNRLEAMTLSERVKIPCLPEKRADVIIAGINILLTVMDFLKCDSILISDHGLRYGALRDFIKKSPSS